MGSQGPMKVAIIGGGAAGLTALRNAPANATVTLFEKKRVGGLWQLPGPMYDHLQTNLPHQVMAYPDFPFPKDSPSWPHHTQVAKYLEDYAQHFNLHSKINYKEVKSVEQHENGFLVDTEYFDAVIVANGHFDQTCFAPIEGFKGKQMHSKDFKNPEPFTNQNVAVLGCGSSGIDIAQSAGTAASSVRWIHRSFGIGGRTSPVENITLHASLSLDENDTTSDGWRCDTIIHCTGYQFTYPFLSSKLQPGGEGQRSVPAENLVAGLFSKIPRLAFIGLPQAIVPMPFCHYQALAIWKQFYNWDLSCYDNPPKQFTWDSMAGDTFVYCQYLLQLKEMPLEMRWRQNVHNYGRILRQDYNFRRRKVDITEDGNMLVDGESVVF